MNKLIPHLFYFFLLAPILSPYVGGTTIYLSSIFLLFDFKFWKWFAVYMDKKKVLTFILIVLIMNCMPIDAATCLKSIIKIFYGALSITYIWYTYVSSQFYLYPYLIINIFFALIQFTLLYVDKGLAMLLGPTSIATAVWGKFATPTYTNFYSIFLLPRVSGLSREGGFFSALINISLLIIVFDYTLSKKYKRFLICLCVVGLLISISKTSIIFLFGLIILRYRKGIRKIPLLPVIILVLFVMVTYFYYIFETSNFFFQTDANGTFIHRFVGYAITPKLTFEEWITGGDTSTLLSKVDNRLVYTVMFLREFDLNDFCGLPALYLNHGVWFFFMFIVLWYWLKFSPVEFLLIVLFCADSAPDTSDAFMQIGWFLCLYLINEERLRIASRHTNSNLIEIGALKKSISRIY